MGALKTLVNVLDFTDMRVSKVALEALEAMLNKVENQRYVDLVEELGGVDKLEMLQDSEDNKIFEKAKSILETHFCNNDEYSEDENELENDAPAHSPATFAIKDDTSSPFTFGGETNAFDNSNGFNVADTTTDWGSAF